MKAVKVCPASEIPVGGRKIIDIEGRSIGIFNLNGEFYALRNVCPHQFAPLCLGKVTGYNAPSEVGVYDWRRQGEIIRCPWHGWEFDIKTGKSIFNPHKVRTKSYPVTVEAGGGPGCGHGCDDEDESVETYPVTIETGHLFVHL